MVKCTTCKEAMSADEHVYTVQSWAGNGYTEYHFCTILCLSKWAATAR